MSKKHPAIYILSNKPYGTLYIGVTSNLIKRVFKHKNDVIKSFTSKYQCHQLVYYELFDDMYNAISREKQLKAGSRKNKIKLINKANPKWQDLYPKICS